MTETKRLLTETALSIAEIAVRSVFLRYRIFLYRFRRQEKNDSYIIQKTAHTANFKQ